MIRNDLSYADYSKIDAINWSRLKVIGVSPLQFIWERDNPRPETGYLRIGRAVHAYLLEPATFKERFAKFDGTRRGKAWDATKAHAESGGITLLSEDEFAAAIGCAAAVLANPHASEILKRGLKEATFTWKDEVTGLECKGRIDHVGKHLVDLKTAARMNQRVFASAAARLGYHSQLAFYRDGLEANGLDVSGDPFLIAVQSEMPHDVITYRLPPPVIEAGRTEYRRLLEKLAECRRTNQWPGAAPDGPVSFELPAWAYLDDEALELTMGGVAIGGL